MSNDDKITNLLDKKKDKVKEEVKDKRVEPKKARDTSEAPEITPADSLDKFLEKNDHAYGIPHPEGESFMEVRGDTLQNVFDLGKLVVEFIEKCIETFREHGENKKDLEHEKAKIVERNFGEDEDPDEYVLEVPEKHEKYAGVLYKAGEPVED